MTPEIANAKIEVIQEIREYLDGRVLAKANLLVFLRNMKKDIEEETV